MDRYTARAWASIAGLPSRAAVDAAVPDGHDLHVTHGGTRYTARLYRDGAPVSERQETSLRMALRLVPLRLCFVCQRREEDVTVDVDGDLRGICDTCYQRREDDRR
jgi:hypothetical protein